MEKAEFESVDHVFHAMFAAFHPDGIESDDEMNENLFALFTLFLTSVGWTDSEYWEIAGEMEEELTLEVEKDKKKFTN